MIDKGVQLYNELLPSAEQLLSLLCFTHVSTSRTQDQGFYRYYRVILRSRSLEGDLNVMKGESS